MVIKKKSSLGVIRKSLTVAVLQNKPKIFLYHLLANNIETTFPNKLNFYRFFTRMLKCAYKTSKGKLHLRIENPEWDKEGSLHFVFMMISTIIIELMLR
ncbi:hypothetical protein GCM10022271_07820 [Corallibacter vietnamensis]|uniref:Uncharacterized protein n=1 Tax=Corallibacter vietnamensis TaxID=904130 RepID=A0ABP7H4S5_9FLAO